TLPDRTNTPFSGLRPSTPEPRFVKTPLNYAHPTVLGSQGGGYVRPHGVTWTSPSRLCRVVDMATAVITDSQKELIRFASFPYPYAMRDPHLTPREPAHSRPTTSPSSCGART